MTPEEAYEETLRRIREAETTEAIAVDLRGIKTGESTGLETLTRLPPELERLTKLQSLNLAKVRHDLIKPMRSLKGTRHSGLGILSDAGNACFKAI